MHDLIKRLDLETYHSGFGLGKSPLHWSAYWGSRNGQDAPFRLGATRLMPPKFILGFLELQCVAKKLAQLVEGVDLTDPFGSNPEKAKELDSISLKSFLDDNSHFKTAREFIEVKAEAVHYIPVEEISLLCFITWCHSREFKLP